MRHGTQPLCALVVVELFQEICCDYFFGVLRKNSVGVVMFGRNPLDSFLHFIWNDIPLITIAILYLILLRIVGIHPLDLLDKRKQSRNVLCLIGLLLAEILGFLVLKS